MRVYVLHRANYFNYFTYFHDDHLIIPSCLAPKHSFPPQSLGSLDFLCGHFSVVALYFAKNILELFVG